MGLQLFLNYSENLRDRKGFLPFLLTKKHLGIPAVESLICLRFDVYMQSNIFRPRTTMFKMLFRREKPEKEKKSHFSVKAVLT